LSATLDGNAPAPQQQVDGIYGVATFRQKKEFEMNELTVEQANEVSGGVLPYVAVLAFVYYERNEIRDFVGGVLDGFNGTDYMKPD